MHSVRRTLRICSGSDSYLHFAVLSQYHVQVVGDGVKVYYNGVAFSVLFLFHEISHIMPLTALVFRATFVGALDGPTARLLLALEGLTCDVRRAAYAPFTQGCCRNGVIFLVEDVVRNTHCEA
jgi:hypothetical protein